jgi:hypothetical protein
MANPEPENHCPNDNRAKIEAACRRWWDCPDVGGKRIATRGWDEIPEEWKHDYRRRMAAALELLG